jgi:hypothetical protein
MPCSLAGGFHHSGLTCHFHLQVSHLYPENGCGRLLQNVCDTYNATQFHNPEDL